ncbi:hypothetical protein GALMADRAFT_66332 [Galerina marginata CBS 339.88]|uniref:Uncharacterized protein n=1 Tax=Galerina marginata (strain CBS 339.88) TaxID=685588 RepID=A0A067TE16_GALM3|nr:hypothetical protein GALMADRAFT_66332 [Galerina marginata CBS 339.88]
MLVLSLTLSQTVFYIPYHPDDTAEDQKPEMPKSIYEGRDLEDGQVLRFVAYRAAWRKCLGRMLKILKELQNSYANAVALEVKSSYATALLGLPYPELPVISIINPALGSPFLDDVTTQLENGQFSSDGHQLDKCIVTHLYPGDFPNVSTGMKSVISGFLEKDEMFERVKRKPATSLANYDIKFLVAWYRAWLDSFGLENQPARPNLVVVLHDFEQYDPFVMQDVFYICSGSVPQIPLVFMLSMSSPSPNYLNSTYPRATMSLLRVRTFTAPSGQGVLQEVLLKTFFDVGFDPEIMIGPTILEYLQDYFKRYHSSIDSILTILQLAHLRHFSSEPLTALVSNTPSLDTLSQPASSGFVNALTARLSLPATTEDVDMDGEESHHLQDISLAVKAVDNARQSFHSTCRNLRIGFGIMLCIQTFLEQQGHKGLDWFANLQKGGLCNAMISLLKGHFTRDVKDLVRITGKLTRDELRGLLDRLHKFFFDMLPSIRTEENGARTTLVQLKSSLAIDSDTAPSLPTSFSDWLAEYLGEKLRPLDELELWDVWYTGLSPFPSEILNPSIRAVLMGGLLRPHDYVEDINRNGDMEEDSKDIWELPDTSILFKRYLDSGKMINVYDWFESFKTVVDSQRTHLKEQSSPKKRGKGKTKRQPTEIMTEEDEEKWNIEVQARFIRALHELDYLGFIKHTGRKADHLVRTIFDIDDAE